MTKRKIFIFFCTISIIAFGINVLHVFDTPLSYTAAQRTTTIPSTSTAEQNTNTTSYYLFSAQNQDAILAHNETTHRAPASTVKLLTGLVAMQSLNEDEMVKVGSEVQIENSTLGLKPGDTIRVRDLLTAIYLDSANDAAVALAVKAKGSLPKFLEGMNQYALQLGCQNSQFQTPNGLPAPDQYTTAQDLSKIAVAFTQNKMLMQYVQEKEGRVEWTSSNGQKKSVQVRNTNEFLGVYPGDEGLKTGTTTEAGQCLVSYITRPDGNLILVLLGSKNRYQDTLELLDQGVAAIRTRAALRNLSSSPEFLIHAPGFYQP